MAQKCHTPAGAGAARAAVFENNASENSRPAPQVNSERTAPTRPTCADPDPLFRQKGEKIADWMRRWRGLGLLEPWAACLPLDGLPIPLAIGVRDQLLQRLNTAVRAPERFARLLGHYCHQRIYLTGLARHGAQRHDIGGQPVGPVAPEHQRHAREQLNALSEKLRRREEATGAGRGHGRSQAGERREADAPAPGGWAMRGIELCGFLARDAEARTTKAGKPMAIPNVGVPDGGQSEGEGGAGDVTWTKVLVFNERAEAVQGLTRGARIYVEGQLKLDRWTAADGAERTTLTVLARTVQPLGQIGRRRPQSAGCRGDRARRAPTDDERARAAVAAQGPGDIGLDDEIPW